MAQGITVVGLGPGDPGLITRAGWQTLLAAAPLFARTAQHPALGALPADVEVQAFDALYESQPSFAAVYQGIVERLLQRAAEGQAVVYAVPGDPTVGEATVGELRRRCGERGIPVHIVHGVSFVEPCLAAAGLDALDGLHLADALELAARHHPPFPPDIPALIGQLYSPLVAGEAKIVLMNQYPEEHPVLLLHAVGSPQARVESVALWQIDRSQHIGAMTALLVPPLEEPSSFEALQEVIAHLRAPEGCPWDRRQSHQSLRSHLLEECYEALEAIDQDDMGALQAELGDLLLQIVLQAQIATEEGEFTMAQVIAGIRAKLVRRHPHVFSDLQVEAVDQVLRNWEQLKAEERERAGDQNGILGGVPRGLPALAQAYELQARAARVGFDWASLGGVLAKVQEELEEVQEAPDEQRRAAEMGDLLFAVVNYARWLKVDPEAALRAANRRFRQRFGAMERRARAEGRPLAEMSLEELDALWEAAKGEGGEKAE